MPINDEELPPAGMQERFAKAVAENLKGRVYSFDASYASARIGAALTTIVTARPYQVRGAVW